jgi:hypothetical protein
MRMAWLIWLVALKLLLPISIKQDSDRGAPVLAALEDRLGKSEPIEWREVIVLHEICVREPIDGHDMIIDNIGPIVEAHISRCRGTRGHKQKDLAIREAPSVGQVRVRP